MRTTPDQATRLAAWPGCPDPIRPAAAQFAVQLHLHTYRQAAGFTPAVLTINLIGICLLGWMPSGSSQRRFTSTRPEVKNHRDEPDGIGVSIFSAV